MGRTDYIRGFNDAVEMILMAIKDAKDLDEAREIIKRILGAVVEHKIEQIAREIGYPIMLG